MSMIKEKFNLDETLNYILIMSIAGAILMWMFYVYFNPEAFDWGNSILFMTLAIIFTVLAPLSFAFLWFRKKKA